MKLIELRIPAGFAICYNNLVKGEWIVPKHRHERLIIDLGWSPDSRADGEYLLVIVNDNWETLKEKRSRNRFEIKETLENWLMIQ
ncbi:hypothetical protein EBB07_30500 [Paenibacillaceae bacterium]|nr:hypothetical protein EBB07_30500 [Paenibacillaceae bacterium]